MRVLPSDVVALIEKNFPQARTANKLKLVPAEGRSHAVRELRAKGLSLPKSERPVVDWGLHEYIEVAHHRGSRRFARRALNNCLERRVEVYPDIIGDVSRLRGKDLNPSTSGL
jgi:hypothetical protein